MIDGFILLLFIITKANGSEKCFWYGIHSTNVFVFFSGLFLYRFRRET